MNTRPSNRFGGSLLGVPLTMGVLAAVGLGWWLSSQEKQDTQTIDTNRIVTVERRELIDAVKASGRVEPLARVAVMSRASGIIKSLHVEEGDVVAEGQLLAELDREQLEAQLAQDRADLASASARVAAAEARIEEANVRIDDPEIEFLEREVARLEQLRERGNVSTRDADDAARNLATARFRVKQVKASLPVLQASLDGARADLDAAQASVDRSETALQETSILCPINGVVLLRETEVGDGVSSILTAGGNATQIMTLGDLSRMHVEARVDEVDLGRIAVDMPALVSVDAHRGQLLEGSVERIAPAGSVDQNGIVTFEVRVSIEDDKGLLKPDMTSDIQLVIDTRENILTLPQRALTKDETGRWVAEVVLSSGPPAETRMVPVELGLSDGLITEIVSGLEEGDQVVVPLSRR